MSRITEVFASCRREDRAAFIAYITAGDPSPEQTPKIVRSLIEAGADLIELGIPFSDPVADGATNQAAAERSLAAGTKLDDIFDIIRKIRDFSQVPLVLFTYANPVLRRGIPEFASAASDAGADGVLFTDVPVEEIDRFAPALKKHGLDRIMLVTPTSGKQRIRAASRAGSGFLYLVSRLGVTGTRQELDSGLDELILRVRKSTKLPIGVGFGISTPEQVAAVARNAEAVVVGSAIVRVIAAEGSGDGLLPALDALLRPMTAACRRGNAS